MVHESSLDENQRYYAEMTRRYLAYGGKTLGWHMPLWSTGDTSAERALLRSNSVILEEFRLGQGARVLDAGCGIGGFVLYLAERLEGEFLGVSNCWRHLVVAAHIARARELDSLVRFSCGDLNCLPVVESSFNAVVNQETFCYVSDAEAYARSISHTLKGGGSWVVLDGFVSRYGLAIGKASLMTALTAGWHIEPLRMSETLVRAAELAGLECVSAKDYTKEVRPSAEQFVRTTQELVGIADSTLSEVEIRHHLACGAWGKGVLEGDLRYELLHFRKP